jgi:acetoin utilization deacetylase AcuC-like enzyme
MAARLVVVTPNGPDGHDPGPAHPERPARLTAALAGVADAELGDALHRVSGRPATDGELQLVHDARYLEELEALAARGGGHLDADTVVAPGSAVAARATAGCGLMAIEQLRAGEADAAFVVARPPGHHANRARGRGFCLFKNVAVGAAQLVGARERVLIVDWDVHHGNGTQEIFWNEPSVLYVSTHQSPAYPGTGLVGETGGPSAAGTTMNFPLPPGATGDVALAAIEEVVAPAVEQFSPTWVLISAGFDAHRADPLADLWWTAGDYGLLTSRVAEFAPEPGRLVAFLEGGYDLDALRASVRATVAALAGDQRAPEAPSSGGPGREVLDRTRRAWEQVTS